MTPLFRHFTDMAVMQTHGAVMKKKIIIGVTGSIAAYRACDLVRLFVKGGYSVHTVATGNALRFITPDTLATLSGNPVCTDTFAREKRDLAHIGLRDGAALMLVAPATANIIGKFAAGIADDLLSTTYLSVECPVVIAPAMNPVMYSHRAVQANIERLKSWGVVFIEPEAGSVTPGEEGKGKLADINLIYEVACNAVKG